jgi:archaellum biogenesis ATPase FlaH
MGTTKQPDIVEGILARDRLHLIAGPSGAGKTTLQGQMIEAISLGAPFLGHPTVTVPMLYITADRTRAEHLETCQRIGIDMDKMGVRIVTTDDYATLPLLYEILDKHAKEGYLVFVEPLPFFLVNAQNQPGNINDPVQVARFLSTVKRRCSQGKYTILGSCHGTKSKENNNYSLMREKIAGTSAWGAYTGTNIYVEPQDPTDPESPFRTVHWLLRNSRSFSTQFQFTATGRLEVCQQGKSNSWAQLDKEFSNWPDDSTFTYDQLNIWIELVGCSLKTSQRWLEEKMRTGEVTRIDRGIYRKNKSWKQ